MAKPTCPVIENGVVCGRPAYRRIYCKKHYRRWLKHGDPLRVLPRGNFTDFNAEAQDYFLLFAMTPTDGCRRWPFNYGGGYGRFSYQGERIYVHAAICELWRGPKPEWADDAAHSCGNAWCWAGEHIRWDTHEGNLLDRVEHGTINRGSRHGNSKLTDADVLEIRRRLAAGELQRIIAADYGIHQVTVHDIKARRRWGWLE